MKQSEDIFQNNINYKKIVQKLLSYKKYYFYCILILLIIAFLINRYSVTTYKNNTIVHVSKNQNNSFLAGSPNELSMNFGMFGGQNIIDNEIEIIKSFTLVKDVINSMDLKVSYYTYKNSPLAELLKDTPFTRKRELYNDSPVKVIIDPSFLQPTYTDFQIKFVDSETFEIAVYGKEKELYNYIDDRVESIADEIIFKKRYHFGDKIQTKYFNISIIKTNDFDENFTKNNNLYFSLNNINWLTLEYINHLSAEPTSQLSTLINISLKGTHENRITDFLNSLTAIYMERNLNKKNKTALSTVDFIDTQISDISDSLSIAENRLRSFRSSHQVMDLSYQGQQAFQKLNELETERANITSQRRYYTYLKDYLDNNPDVSDILVPSSMNVVDPILNNLILQLIALNAERAGATNPQNIYLSTLNLKIDNIKKTIRENVNNSLNTLNIALNEINYRTATLSNQISQMPKTELQLKGIERKFKLNDAIYTFLLQKRSEAQIARASSMPDYEIVDPARNAVAYPVAPKKTLNLLIALMLGLILPTSVIMGKDFFNNKISDPEEIESATRIPILGKVFHNFRRTSLVVNQYPNSSVTESFRAIRTNYEFFSNGGQKQVLLLTSTASGEGKSFCSINLASAFALNGNRTVLLEFDLRRPKIHQEFGSSNMIGISSYLIDKAIIEDIIMPTQIENLDLISAGPAAPNPAELIASDKTQEFLMKLKDMYDYIIIDSAPAGILTETYQLMKYSDVNIFVTRIDETIREAFKNTIKAIEANKFSNLAILINDVNAKRDAYKYGYDNKYYTDDKKRGLLARIFGRKRS
ncbi:MAG: polysaccharide biosynthesis tyrosine autokinase [Bacteroidales bacterium]|nr:polysaccharide biosynthesis tyrosine autokinase [Bacteroidales bacterium]